jgi:hypothetical protein
MTDEIRTYSELQKLMHDALRNQHPEWIEANGTSPLLESYDARFADLLTLFSFDSGSQKTHRRSRVLRRRGYERSFRGEASTMA